MFGLGIAASVLLLSNKFFAKYMAKPAVTLIVDQDAELYMKQYQSFVLVFPAAVAVLATDIFVIDSGVLTRVGGFGILLTGISSIALSASIYNGLRKSNFNEINQYIETNSKQILSEDSL